MEKTCGNWMLTYYDQHGYEHGYGIKHIPELPAYFQATDDNSQKQLRYYADKGRTELEQRYQQLEQVARDMYRYMDGVLNRNWAYTLPADTDNFRDQLEALGVSLDD